MEKELERRLSEEADFGDIVEITLNSEVEYCARHDKSNVIISPRENGVEYQERGVLHVLGYYGGMQKGSFKEVMGISETGLSPVLISHPAKTVVCVDPTLHRKDALDTLKFQGEGLVKIPISAITSYEILSKRRRGLRVVN